MNGWLPGALIAAVPGVLIALFNARLTEKAAEKPGGQLWTASVVRMLLSVGYLAAVYFLAPHTPWDRVPMLAGAVVGLTVPMFLLTARLVGRINRENAERRGKGEGE